MKAEKGIFLDVLPRFDFAALALILDKAMGMFKKTGAAAGQTFGAEAQRAVRKYAVEAAAATNKVTDAELRAERAVHAHEVARLRLGEIMRRDAVAASTLARAQYAVADAERAATLRARDLEAARRNAAAATDSYNAAVAGSTVAMGNMGKVANVAGAAATGTFLYGVSKAANAAGDFQEKMTRLVAAAGESPGNFQMVAEGLMRIASQTGYSAQELSDAMFMVEKSGFRGADGLKVMQAAAQLARAENASLEEGISGLTTSMNDFHYPADQAALVASKMVVAAGNAKTRIQEFSGALRNIEPIAMIAGIKLDEVYASLARVTQSGTSPEMGSQQLANFVQHLLVIQQPQRDAMGKIGLDADELKEGLADPKVGLLGILNQVSQAINSRLTPEMKVQISAHYENARAVKNLKEAYEALSPQAQKAADMMQKGLISAKEFRSGKWASTASDKSKMTQYGMLYDKLEGFSSNIKKGAALDEEIAQIWKEVTGTDAGFKVAAQLFGSKEGAAKTVDVLRQIQNAHADKDGNVKGFHEMMLTLNNTMRQAKASFENAGISLGNFFMPVVMKVAEAVRSLGQLLEKHPGILQTVATAIGLVSAAWLSWKAIVLGAWFLDKIAAGLSLMGTLLTGLVGRFTAVGAASVVSGGQVVASSAAGTAAMGRLTGAATLSATAMTGVGAAAARALGPVAALAAAVAGVATLRSNMQYANGEQMSAFPSMDDFDPRKRTWGEILLGGKVGGWWDKVLGIQPKPRQAEGGGGGSDSGEAGHNTAFEGMPDEYQKYALFNAFGQGEKGYDALIESLPGLDGIVNPAETTLPEPAPTPEGGFPSGGGSGGKEKPDGTKIDPVYTMPIPEGPLSVGGGSSGAAGGDGVGMNYDPFQEAGQGGFTLPNIARLMATFFTNMALGNPYGKLQAAKRGESPSNPMYVQMADGAGGLISLTKDQLKIMQATLKLQEAQSRESEMTAKYGPGSPEALRAQLGVTKAQQGLDNLRFQQSIPSGATDADVLNAMGVGPGRYAQTQAADLTQGLGDCSSAVEDLVNLMDGMPTGGRQMSTANAAEWLQSRGFMPGYQPGAFNVAFNQTHMQATLPGGTPFNWGSDSSAANAGIGGSGALDPALTQRFYRPVGLPLEPGLAPPVTPPVGGGIGGGGGLLGALGGAPGSPMLTTPSLTPSAGPVPGAAAAGPPSPLSTMYPNGYGGGTSMGRTPIGANQSRQFGQDGGPSGGGFGVKGGLLGMAQGAASTGISAGINAIAPGAGQAASAASDILTQEANRFVGYVGQLAGIGVSGLLETFSLNDSAIADPSKSWFGKIAMGLAGARPATPNTAGETAPPLKAEDAQQQGGGQNAQPGPLVQINEMHNHGGDGQQVGRDIGRQMMAVNPNG